MNSFRVRESAVACSDKVTSGYAILNSPGAVRSQPNMESTRLAVKIGLHAQFPAPRGPMPLLLQVLINFLGELPGDKQEISCESGQRLNFTPIGGQGGKMREFVERIEKEVERTTPEVSPGSDSDFRQAAYLWAQHSIKTFDGDLCRKALLISAAMTDFCNELEMKP